ncbi:MAG: aldehyde dehydrogenase family protein [Rhodobacteraceae bacterium]|nr:aldehyde dehydrogenase family protein [Paracoccaceae bacterium]
MIDNRQFYIDGAWVNPTAPRDFDVIDPSTEDFCATISLGDQADTDAAVTAARRAFDSWSQTSPAERKELIESIYEVYKERAEEMSQAISQEMGAPIDLARNSQTTSGTWHIEGFLEAFDDIEWESVRKEKTGERIHREPIGVVGMITPWNWPMNQVTLKVIPALAAGCTMVLKPSEIAPLSSLVFTDIMHEAGAPAGIYNMVNGDGPGVGSQLSEHMDVDMISFTGSTRAGRLITAASASNLKRVSLELGGKGANVIFADADEKAVIRGARHCFNNTGQSCNAPTRMLVERSRYDEAVEQAAATAEKTQVNRASEQGRHIGPVVSEVQYNKIQDLIQKGIDEGARLVAGGTGRPDGLNRGYFIRPTVFADVNNDMTIAREEIFGPVLSIIPFDSEEEAISIANDTAYGLTNYVQTTDDERRLRMARRLRAGMIETNGNGFSRGSPFGGMKQSGNGREGGVFGIEEFQEVKAISGC